MSTLEGALINDVLEGASMHNDITIAPVTNSNASESKNLST